MLNLKVIISTVFGRRRRRQVFGSRRKEGMPRKVNVVQDVPRSVSVLEMPV